MDLVTLLASAAEGHSAKDATPFYIVGGLLALFAVVVGAIGVKRPNWEAGPARAVILVGTVLTAATMVVAVVAT
jgi:hypothetical protein